jgi:arylsulfatase A-like enzyme
VKLSTTGRAGVGAVSLGLGAAVALIPATGRTATTPAPNIVLVVADDLGYDQTSLYGRAGSIPTPHIRGLGDAGVRATEGYVASPVCSPSRSALLTGMEPARVGADSNQLTRDRPERMPTQTIAKALPGRYTSAAIGKWDLAGTKPFDSAHLPAAMGFDDFYGFLGGEHSYCPPEPGATNLKEYDASTGTYADRASTEYLTNDFTNHAVKYINGHARDSGAKPFFLYLAYNAPHTPLETPTTCAGGVQDDQNRFAEMVTTLDDGVGRVRQAVADNGIADNTLFIFLSDNGQQTDFFTGPTRGGKYTLFEGGVKVPFALSWPRVLPAGKNYSKPVSSLDLKPTILAAAGSAAGPPAGAPGVDLIPFFTGRSAGAPHTTLSWRYVADKAAEGTRQGSVMVAQRSGDLKWIRTSVPAPTGNATTSRNFLFNLSGNPQEKDAQNLWPNTALSNPVVADHNSWNAGNTVVESFKNPRTPPDERAEKPDGYLEAGGDWTVLSSGSGDKSYRGTSVGPTGRSVLEASYYGNVKATSTVRLLDPGQAGIIVRGSGAGDSFDGYVALIAIAGNGSDCAGPAPQPAEANSRILLTKVLHGATSIVACRNVALSTGTDYALGVRAVGTALSVSLDGAQQLAWSDNGQALTGGRVGLRVAGTSPTQNTRALFATLNAAG